VSWPNSIRHRVASLRPYGHQIHTGRLQFRGCGWVGVRQGGKGGANTEQWRSSSKNQAVDQTPFYLCARYLLYLALLPRSDQRALPCRHLRIIVGRNLRGHRWVAEQTAQGVQAAQRLKPNAFQIKKFAKSGHSTVLLTSSCFSQGFSRFPNPLFQGLARWRTGTTDPLAPCCARPFVILCAYTLICAQAYKG
jgi:hypothetical protein